jgi:DNA-binding SARP family transcriptional activator/TolB-like protein/Flp pilus assembly protein TadD
MRLDVLGGIDLIGPEGSLRGVLAQPKRFALLVYLTLQSRRGFVRRDTILSVFWPEHEQTKARTSLRQALRFLRTALGDDAFDRRGDDEIAVREGAMDCDATRFERAIAERRFDDALDEYRGDFLAGFFVAGSGPELDQWLEDDRGHLRQLAMRAATTLTTQSENAGDVRGAARWARRAVAISPHDEAAQRSLIRLLDAGGDRAGALYAYETFAKRLEREMEATPTRETQQLVARIRSRVAASDPAGRSLTLNSGMPAVAPPVTGAATPAGASRIVVIPFAYHGPEDERHLGHGLADEIRSALQSVPGLDVVSRLESMAFESVDPDRAVLRDRLRATVVLTGRLERHEGRLTLSARLRDVATGRDVWKDEYTREMSDLFAMQERLARAVVAALRISLAASSSTRLVRQPTRDLEAYNLYLRGRYHWMRRPRETRKSLEYFDRAIARDPLFALAHAGIADAYNTLGSWEAAEMPSWEAFPRAHAAAMQALALDPTLAEAHTALGYANIHYLWRWDDAREELERGLALNPSYSHAHHWHSHYLTARGCAAESLEASRRALEVDPLDLIINVHMAWHYWFAREYDEAVEQSVRAAELEPNNQWSPFFAGMGHAGAGKTGLAIEQHRLAVARSSESPVMLGALGYSLATGGERSEAEAILRRLHAVAESRSVSSYEIAVIHGALADRDAMFDWLDRAYEERSAWLAYLAVDPRLDGVRDDDRFRTLLRAVRLDPVARQPR